MITKEEFEIISKYGDILTYWHSGGSTIVTRVMWDDVYPIAKKNSGFSGTLGCAYCCMKLCEVVYALWDAYKVAESAKVKEVKVKSKSAKNVKKEEK